MTAWDQVIKRTAEHVRRTLENDTTGHDWWHIDRVRRNALRIAAEEKADMVIVELAALLHDIADWKFHGGDDTAGPRAAHAWLSENNIDPAVVDAVCDIVARVTFKGAGVSTEMPTIEGKCVQDGDRLDAIGAIGVARAFTYGGHMGRPMHDPSVPAELHSSFAAYKSKSGPTINHFYEKLLLLKDRMQTDSGRRIAHERHAFMENYLQQFLAEWNGADGPVVTQTPSA
ncbi:HD domain-containing protein [Schlesneria sp. DSM 10557]|uniref:HD domain-containing protein n=1 Tax=Schlesneria sp. DSM 10557 TaxID=3044399 RepID=UPI0035A06958